MPGLILPDFGVHGVRRVDIGFSRFSSPEMDCFGFEATACETYHPGW